MKSSPSLSDSKQANAEESAADPLIGELLVQSELQNETGGKKLASPFKSRIGANSGIDQTWLPSSSASQQPKLNRTTLAKMSLCSLLVVIGLLGASLVGTTRTTRSTATADALLPYSSQAPTAEVSLPSNVLVSRINPQTASAAAAAYEFQATAPNADTAISEVDAASQSAVQRNSAAWASAASRNQAALAAMPLARVIRSGTDNPVHSHTFYGLNAHRFPFALLWLAAFTLAAALIAAVKPKPKRRLKFAFRSPAGTRSGSRSDAPRIEDLPQMASVHLARDVSQASDLTTPRLSEYSPKPLGSDLRPVLSKASEKLWVNFASRADLASAMSSASAAAVDQAASSGDIDQAAGTHLARYDAVAQAVLQQAETALSHNANTEILFTRLTRDARGSRAAMLAIARLLAQRGKRVVLVDLDFAAPPEAQAELGLPGEFPGAAEILSQRAKLDDCLLSDDDYPALTAIASSLEGTEITHEQAASLLQSAEMLDLLDELREGNHLVLIHGPAAEDAARSLGSRADAALLVVGQVPTDHEHQALPDALAEMSAVQANIVGRIEFHGEIA